MVFVTTTPPAKYAYTDVQPAIDVPVIQAEHDRGRFPGDDRYPR